MAKGYLHGALESTPGTESNTPTLSTKVIYFPLITAGNNPGVAHMDRNDENRNSDEPLSVLSESKTPTWSYESRVYPDLLGFLLTNLLGEPTTTAGNGVITDPDSTTIPTGAYRHVWTSPFGPTGASPKTAQYQFSYVDQSVYVKVKGAAVASLSLTNPMTGGARIAVSGPANYWARQSSPGLTATYESLSVRPFTRRDLVVTSGLSGWSTTLSDFSLTANQGVEQTHTMGVKSQFPDLMEKGDGPILWTGSAPKRQLDADDIDALLAATGFTLTARYTSDTTIASSYPYKFYVVGSNAQLTDGSPNDLSNTRNIGADLSFALTSAGSASTTVTLVNATTGYV